MGPRSGNGAERLFPYGEALLVSFVALATTALVATLALTLYYTILLFAFADPDPGPIFSGYLGLVLFGAAALAIGLLASTLTSNQIVAAVVAMGILLVLYFADTASGGLGNTASNIIAQVGIKSHFDDFARGVIDTRHVLHYLCMVAFFLFLTIRALESRRWR